jgi:hypothetical protein
MANHRATTIRRSDVKRLALIFTLAILAGALLVPAANAQSNLTNLNNIPVTDTLAVGTFEWDVWSGYNKGFERGRRIGTRLFGSLYDNLEFGMKWGISRTAGPVELALKYKVIDEYNGRFPISLAVGVEGITGNSQRTGIDPTVYGVLGIHDLKFVGHWWDWYVGVNHNPTGLDTEDNSLFGGFKFWINDDIQFNADYMGYSDNEWYKLTGGFNYNWINHIGFQGWVERDSLSETNVFVLEMAVRADMRDLTAEVSDPE